MRIDALGVDVDLVGERLRLTDSKRERYAVHATEVAEGRHCDHVSFLRLLGRLTSAVQCYPDWQAATACSVESVSGVVPSARRRGGGI